MLGTLWNTLLFQPFLNLLLVFSHLLGNNLGLGVIAMAIIIRLLLVPSTKKQMTMMQKMAGLKPRLDKLQKKYGANQQKLAEEQMKLYKEVGYNPIGCLGSFLPQILVLYVIIQAINAVTSGSFEPYSFLHGWLQLDQLNLHLIVDLTKSYSTVANGNYFAVNAIPYFVLAVLVGFIQYLSTKFMQIMQGAPTPTKKKTKKNEQMSMEDMQAQMTGSMNSIFPIMTGVITLSAPAILGVYWLAQSVMFIAQYFIIDKEKSLQALQGLFRKN